MSGWNLERIRTHIAAHLPLAAVFGIEVLAATPDSARARLTGNANSFRPGGCVAGPVLFAMADVVTYALTLSLRGEEQAVTSSLSINFFRPAAELPLLIEAVPLRAGRQLITYDVRIWPERAGAAQLVAQATATWAMPQRSAPIPIA